MFQRAGTALAIAFQVPAANTIVFTTQGEAWIRKGAHTRLASPMEVLSQLRLEGDRDAVPVPVTLEDLDPKIVDRFIARWSTMAPDSGIEPPRDGDRNRVWTVLEQFRLVHPIGTKAGVPPTDHLAPTLSGLLVLGRATSILGVLPGARVELLRFQGSEPTTKPIVSKTLTGPIPELVTKTTDEVLALASTRVQAKGLYRSEISDYPKEIVRELVTNALVHRRYDLMGAVSINIFNDRIEIANPGALSVDSLTGGPPINPTNPRIMLALRILGVTEGLGLGLAHVRQAAIKAGLPEPRVRTLGDQTTATVWGNALPRSVAHVLEKTSGDFGPRERQVLILAAAGDITTAQVAVSLGVTQRTAVRVLNYLMQRGLLARRGGSRSTYYQLVTKEGPNANR